MFVCVWEDENSYTKPQGQIPDYSAPIVLRSTHCTVEDLCMRIHKRIIENFK